MLNTCINLDKLSCFPFENHLQQLMKYIKTAHNPLAQIVKCVTEMEIAGVEEHHKNIFTKAQLRDSECWHISANNLKRYPLCNRRIIFRGYFYRKAVLLPTDDGNVLTTFLQRVDGGNFVF